MTVLDVIKTLWPLLALLGYILVTSVLAVLASAHQHEVQRHDLVRHARQRRLEYLKAMAADAQPPEV